MIKFKLDIKSDFKKWACGFSGMDGGNPNGEVWFCGIEYGGGENPEELDFTENVSEIPFRDTDDNPEWFAKTQFNQKIAKIVYTYINGKLNDGWRIYMENNLYTKNGESLKMNLYPIPFKDTSEEWTIGHYKRIGIPNKELYRSWCMINRFPNLRGKVEKYSPKILICTGNKFRTDFLYAFCNHNKIYDNIFKIRKLPTGKYIELFKFNNNKTNCIITPFLGQGGIMADKDLKKLAMICRRL